MSDFNLTPVKFFDDIIILNPDPCGSKPGGCTCGSGGCSCFYGNNGTTL